MVLYKLGKYDQDTVIQITLPELQDKTLQMTFFHVVIYTYGYSHDHKKEYTALSLYKKELIYNSPFHSSRLSYQLNTEPRLPKNPETASPISLPVSPNKDWLELVFLSPYSPGLNLIEGLWKWLKKPLINNVFFSQTYRK